MTQAATFAQARANTFDLQSSQYRKSKLISRYDADSGLLVIPVMGPAGTLPTVVRVHAPIGHRVVSFEYARDGSPPVFPAQADTDSGDVLLTSSLDFPAPRETSDDRLLFGVRGEYSFVQAAGVRGTESQYPIDRHPYLSLVDMLGVVDRYGVPAGSQGGLGNYNTATMDARFLCSYGILS